jgi:hypothetical protein
MIQAPVLNLGLIYASKATRTYHIRHQRIASIKHPSLLVQSVCDGEKVCKIIDTRAHTFNHFTAVINSILQ